MIKIAPALLALSLCCAPIYCAHAQNAPATLATAALPRPGEIALEGRVAALGDRQFTLEVTAFVNPNGKRALLAAPKNKTIALDALSALAPALKIGETVSVLGINGADSLKARALVRARQIVGEAPVSSVASAALTAPWLPAFVAGDLTITPVQAGFDYSTNVFPGVQTLEQTPVFTCTFGVKSAATGATTEEIARRIVLRRIIGPQNQFVAPFSLDILARPVEGQPNGRVGFTNAGVDPNWEWIDMDLDVIAPSTTERESGGKIELEDVALPAPGAETPIDRAFSGALGTQFRVVKIRRDEKGWTFVTVRHQKPAAPADLELASYNLKFSGAKAQSSSGGGGGLGNGFSASGENELLLSTDETLGDLSKLSIEIVEKAPSLADRAGVTRQRLRYDLKRLRATETMAPVALNHAPVELGRAQSGEVEVRAESDGLSWSGNTVMLLMAAKSAPANAQRGLRWNIASGQARFDNGAPDAELQTTSGAMINLWHSDGTPLLPGETIERKSLTIPAGAKTYDLKLNLEGRVTLEEWFALDIPIARDKKITKPTGDEEHGLILRKIQRFSAPDELANYPAWIRGQWPNAGLALVFEANPLLLSPEFFANAFDAEDDRGRELKTGTLIEQSLYNMDMTDADSKFRQSKFHTLIVGQPAPDAQSIKVWLHLSERASNVDKAAIEIKNIAVTPFNP